MIDDIRVELTEEFVNNFDRHAFFDKPWKPWKNTPKGSKGGKREILVNTGNLKNSISSTATGNTIKFTSYAPYASLQNDGGTVHQTFVPTTKTRRWAWVQYRETKNEKFKRMALCKKINRTFCVPARPFIGDHPQVRKSIDNIVSDTIAKCVAKEIGKDLKIN